MIATPEKALITVGQGYGNIVMATPTMAALHALGYSVDVLVESHHPRAASLLSGWAALDTIFLNRASLMNSNPCYNAIVRTVWNRSAPLNLGPETLPEPLSLRDHHEAIVNVSAAKKLGFTGPLPPTHVESELPLWPLPKNYIVIAPGYGGSKRADWSRKAWPHWRTFCEQAHERFRVEVIVLGTEADEEPWMQTADLPWLHTFCGRTSIRGAAGIIGQSRALIAVDNGLAHIGGAMNVPVVALFGPTSEIKNRPLGPRVRLLTTTLACRPCQMTERWVSCGDWRCMNELSPQEVLQNLENILEQACPSSPTK